ncbi:hypothetical protein AVEN_64327-1 [Araneus ventricosus]|uniref:Uncharacterized protein n=1 Tax=Araneus ventricosus TaxID=182803 RepID=A0A4Y2DAG7_ARAVE|nr:hypothetical protein AVEN_64327-1 [Araneus ventricosus]
MRTSVKRYKIGLIAEPEEPPAALENGAYRSRAGWCQIRNLIPSKIRNLCGPSVIWSTNESMVKRPIIDVVLKFGKEDIGPGIVLVI